MSLNIITLVLEGAPMTLEKFSGAIIPTEGGDVILDAVDRLVEDFGYRVQKVVIASDCEKVQTFKYNGDEWPS